MMYRAMNFSRSPGLLDHLCAVGVGLWAQYIGSVRRAGYSVLEWNYYLDYNDDIAFHCLFGKGGSYPT